MEVTEIEDHTPDARVNLLKQVLDMASELFLHI